jgi:hypothetical protein
MLSTELMDQHQVITVWSCSKREETNGIGFVKAYLGECANGSWLAVTTSWEESEVFLLNTRHTALRRIRDRGFYTRISKVYSSKQGASE